MVQVDLPGAFAVGQIMALCASKYLKKDPEIATGRLMGPLNVYLACGYAPAGMFLLTGWPTWELMFVTDWAEKPYDRPLVAGFYVLFFILMVLIGNIGFMLGHKWYRQGKDSWVKWGSAIGVFATVLPFLLCWGIWREIGTYADKAAGTMYPMLKPPFFHGWLCIMGWLGATTIGFGLWMRHKSKTAHETPPPKFEEETEVKEPQLVGVGN